MGGSSVKYLATVPSSLGYYDWTILSDLPGRAARDKFKTEFRDRFKITVQDASDYKTYDYSDDYFSIVAAEAQVCTDTDGGKDYYTKGTTKLNGQEKVDVCRYSYIEPEHTAHDNVIEYFCQSNNLIGEEKNYCPNGCSDGACIKGDEPYCANIGTRSEGWIGVGIPDIQYENCDGCYAECKAIGSKSEGWYSSGSCETSGKLIKYDNCGEGQEEPSITVTYPNGGEEWVVGQRYEIKWEQKGLGGEDIYIGLLIQHKEDGTLMSGGSYFSRGAVANQESYHWFITDWQVPEPDKYKYKIVIARKGEDITDMRIMDESDDYFSIVAEGTSVCTDSDGGINQYVKGTACRPSTVHDGLFCRTDRCIPLPDGDYSGTGMPRYLTEYYCKDDKMFSKTIKCENGCANGACLGSQEEPTPSITVTYPNGGETWVKGQTYEITRNSAGFQDVSVSLLTYDSDYHLILKSYDLGHHIEDKGYIKWTIPFDNSIINAYPHFKLWVSGRYKDPSGTVDYIGLIDESDDYFSIVEAGTQTCTDTDGGKNYYVKGTLTFPTTAAGTGGIGTQDDVCIDASVLAEYYCEGSDVEVVNYTCPNGCLDGACKGDEIPSSIIVKSPNGGETWVIGNTYDITWKEERTTENFEIYLRDDRAGPSYKLIATDLPFSARKYSWTIPSDFWGSRFAGSGYKIKVQEIGGEGVYDESDNYFSIVAAGTQSCTDTDGGENKYVKGTACRPSTVHDGLFCRTDRCIPLPDGDYSGTGMRGYLTEYYCKDGKIFSKTIHCENGCANGACLEAQEECAKEGEQVNRNPLMGPTDRQCCEGLVENRVSKSYSICEKPTEEPTPSITVISPNGGEEWVIGQAYDIKWVTSNWPDNTPVQISLNPMHGGDHFIMLTPNDGIENYTVPSEGIVPGNNFIIKMHCPTETGNYNCPNDVAVYDSSDDYFSIVAVGLSDCHTSPLWKWDYCSPGCKCNDSEGDCDTDVDCAEGLFCAKNVGANYGQDSRIDVCEKAQNTTY